ncbi:MAG TPA: PrsW family glutamic-type intramembrane protease [Micromonosporaceae bacterium]|nr:PrsW family glutamic-type intramembrane protease [Micromonosporaceae bacterium]
MSRWFANQGPLSALRAARALLARPAVWFVAIAFGAGAWRVAHILGTAVGSYPVATVTAIVLFACNAVPFLLLIGVINFLGRQLVSLRVLAFVWGALVAVPVAIQGGTAAQNVIAKALSPAFAADWGPAVGGAAVEELVKAAGVVTIALLAPTRFRTVTDGFVYGALIGLGFQVVENVVFAVNAVAAEGSDRAGPVVATFLLRGLVAGAWSHALFTAIAGAGIAYALTGRRPPGARAAVAGALVGAAWAFHFVLNAPWLSDGFGYGATGVFLAVLLKGTPALVAGATVIVLAERRDAAYYGRLLTAVNDPRIATPEEIVALVSPLRRLAERRRARHRLGRAGGRAVRRLQRAQAKLAVTLARAAERTCGPYEVARRRREVLLRRRELLASLSRWVAARHLP